MPDAPARRLILLLAALTAVLLASASSALAGAGAQNAVGAFSSAAPTHAVSQASETACTHPGLSGTAAGSASGFCVAAEDAAGVAEDAAGVVYRRTDLAGGKPYIGQAINDSRYATRQLEHARANPFADFSFEIVGRAEPGTPLDRLEEYFIRQEGGPTNLSNPEGALANARHQMSDPRYQTAGGDPFGP